MRKKYLEITVGFYLVILLALNAYLSTPKFIKALTDISHALIEISNRDDYLKEELKKINKMLPASVYIPLVNSIITNFIF